MKFNGVELAVGVGVAELMWTDRKLLQITAVIDDRTFAAKRVEVQMECWQDGTEYPVKNPDGSWVLKGKDRIFRWSNRGHGSWRENGRKVNINIGATTGYRDPLFDLVDEIDQLIEQEVAHGGRNASSRKQPKTRM